MKLNKIIGSSIISLAVASSLSGISYEYPQIYKDTKIMGMGGANIAIGGQNSSIFYNSAGVSKIPKEHGWEVEIANLGISVNDNITDFIDDVDNATGKKNLTTIEEVEELDKVISKHAGKNNHLSANVAAISIGKKFEEYAVGVVPFGGALMNYRPYMNVTPTGLDGRIELDGMTYNGLAIGVSKDIKDFEIGGYEFNNLSVGAGVKHVSYKSWVYDLDSEELTNSDKDIAEYIEDNIAKDGTSTVLDLGMQYDIYPDLQFGVAVQNIGSIGDSKSVEIPMTVGIGVGYTYRTDDVFFNEFRFAADFTDLTQEYKQDGDFLKRTRLGVNGKVAEGWGGELGLQAGLYQGEPTFGVELRALALKIAYSTYSETLGKSSGDKSDRRHMFNFSLGF